jgi:hypothetical protein
MRRSWMLAVLLGASMSWGLAGSASAHDAKDMGMAGMEAGQEVTIKGELVDSLCYVTMAATGAGHKQCAIDCAKAGIPVSILEDGTGKLYTVLPSKDKTGYPESVTSKMGDKVTLKGDLYEKGGNKYVAVESVE